MPGSNHTSRTRRSVAPAEWYKQENATPPGIQPQTFAIIKVDLGSCYLFVPPDRLLHSFYVKTAGHKDVCRDLRPASKEDSTQGRIFSLIPKLAKLGLQSEDIEKRGPTAKAFEHFPFIYTTAWGLWYSMLIHLQNSGSNSAASKTVAKNWITVRRSSSSSQCQIEPIPIVFS